MSDERSPRWTDWSLDMPRWATGLQGNLADLLGNYQARLDQAQARLEGAREANRYANQCYRCAPLTGDPFLMMVGLCYRHAHDLEVAARQIAKATRCYRCEPPSITTPAEGALGLCPSHAMKLETERRQLLYELKQAERRRDQLEDDLATTRVTADLGGFVDATVYCGMSWSTGKGQVPCQLRAGHSGPHSYVQDGFLATWPVETFTDEEPF